MTSPSKPAFTAGPALTAAQYRALKNAEKFGRADFGISGRSAHGGYAGTRAVWLRHGYINPFNEKITDAGRAALAETSGVA